MTSKSNIGDIIVIDDFNDYADGYDHYIYSSSSVKLFGESAMYTTYYRLNYIKKIARGRSISNILDFGCGIGKLTSLLAGEFSQANIYGYDISDESIKLAKEINGNFSNITYECGTPYKRSYDVIVASHVFHHLIPGERKKVLLELKDSLSPNGVIVIFEHNPLNPLTVLSVKECIFDKGAILIKKKEFEKAVDNSGLKLVHSRYIFFFPKLLGFFRPLESAIGFLPFGAQYVLVLGNAQ